MYSREIIARKEYMAKKAGAKIIRLPRLDSIEIAKNLEVLRKGKDGKLLPEGALIRPLNKQEQEHIDSERMLCKIDFDYFITRYDAIDRDPGLFDGGGIGPAPLLESQRRIITLLGRREDECYEELKKYKRTRGIIAYIHKVRQIAATATSRAATRHRMLFYSQRCLAASLDEERIGELYKRDEIGIDGLPWWLKPKVYPRVKDTEIGFPELKSRISYQAENQQQGRGGLGVGTQVDVSHFTELALWVYTRAVKFSFVPSLPKAISTLHIQESTARGKDGYWDIETEAARKHKPGYEHCTYVFIPWWMNKQKYSDNVPDDWRPSEHTVKHALLIERSSPEFNDGVVYKPSIDQLYWWEKERNNHIENGELATFLTNYPATPEQSFQSFSGSAYGPETIEWLELGVRAPIACYVPEIVTRNQL